MDFPWRARIRALLPLFLLVCLLAPAAAAQATLTEDDVVAAVREHNATVQAARAGALADAERPDQVRPMFPMAELMLMPQMIAEGQAGVAVGARQTIAWRDRLRAQRAGYEFSALASQLSADALERQVVLFARAAYAELWGVQERRARIDTYVDELELYVESALTNFRTGRGPQQAVLNLELEGEVLQQRLAALSEQEAALSAQLAGLTGGQLRLAPGVRLAPPTSAAPDLDETALADHPAVEAGQAMEEAAAADIRLRQTLLRPDLTVGAAINLSPMAREGRYGQELVTPTIGMTLPLWRGGVRAEIREAEQRRVQRELETRDVRVELAAEAEEVVRRLAEVRARIERYETRLQPRAEQTLEATLIGYQTGLVRFLELLDAQRTALDIDIDLVQARVDEAVLVARLAALAGR